MDRDDMYIPIILLLILILLNVNNYSTLLSLLAFAVICIAIYYKYGIDKNSRIKSSCRELDYTGKSISAFYFVGHKYDVNTWKELLVYILKIMHNTHKKEFDRILDMPGRRRQYFTRHPEKLHVAEEIDDTGIYAETKLGSNIIVGLCYDVIHLFGYSDNDLIMETY